MKFIEKIKKYRYLRKLKKKFSTMIDYSTNIGKYSYIGYWCMITKAQIGNYCSIANNVLIGGGEHDVNRISLNSMFYDNPWELLTKGNVEIGHDVWIGNGVIIRRGVKIGNGAVIGANSFVNKDIPPYAIAVGSPAKVIKYRFNKEKINRIEETQRRNFDPPKAKIIFNSL